MTTKEIILQMCCKLADEWKLEAITGYNPIKVFMASLTLMMLICAIVGRLQMRDLAAAIVLSLQITFMFQNKSRRVDLIIDTVLSERQRGLLANEISSIVLEYIPDFHPFDVDSALASLTPQCKNAMMGGVMKFLSRLPNYRNFTALASNVFP